MPVLTITPQLRTTDLDRSIRFYTEQVGLELEFRVDFYAGIRSGGGSFHLKLVDIQDPSIAFVNEGGHLHLYWVSTMLTLSVSDFAPWASS
jgi:catechol 2,3-dioxygenase-like lactoylglutathione lyase family enzyme